MAYQAIGSTNQLTIKSLSGGTSSPVRFPAYLDSSEIGYVIDSKELPFAPLSFINSKVHLRTRQKLSVKFNVYSINPQESVDNYNNLQNILEWIKPKYRFEQGQYLADTANNTGLIALSFVGLQKTHINASYGEDLKLHLTNFVYSINKDMGYHSSSLSQLTPVGYNLQIDGDILLEFDKTTRVSGKTATNETANIFGNADNDKKQQIIAFYESVTGLKFDNLSSAGQQQAVKAITQQVTSGYKIVTPTADYPDQDSFPTYKTLMSLR